MTESLTDLAALPDKTMKAGRELDALIAEKVMGHQVIIPNSRIEHAQLYFAGDQETLPRYSTDISDAWLVVENLARRGWKIDVQNRYWPCWACHIHFPAPNNDRVFETAEGPNGAAHAICLAALKAVELSPPRVPENKDGK